MIEPYYQEDGITLYCGDCREILPQLDNGSIDLTVTSPPYGNLRTYNGFSFEFEAIAKEIFRVTKDGGMLVWVVGDETVEGSETLTSAKQKIFFNEVCGFRIHDTMIYAKNGPPYPDQLRYQQVFEYMFVFSKRTPKTINLIADKKNRWAGSRNFGTRSNRSVDGKLVQSSLANRTVKELGVRWNIWEMKTGFGYSTTDEEAYEHPAMFPEKLAGDHIISWSNAKEIILDPMAGSGTTLKMARILGRKAIGIEISEKYCEIAVKRLAQMQMDFK